MVKESDAAVSHPDAVMVHSHHTAVAINAAVLSPGRHDFAAGLAPREFANLRHLARVVKDLFLLFGTLSRHL